MFGLLTQGELTPASKAFCPAEATKVETIPPMASVNMCRFCWGGLTADPDLALPKGNGVRCQMFNDFAGILTDDSIVCATVWITSPVETKYILKRIVTALGLSAKNEVGAEAGGGGGGAAAADDEPQRKKQRQGAAAEK